MTCHCLDRRARPVSIHKQHGRVCPSSAVALYGAAALLCGCSRASSVLTEPIAAAKAVARATHLVASPASDACDPSEHSSRCGSMRLKRSLRLSFFGTRRGQEHCCPNNPIIGPSGRWSKVQWSTCRARAEWSDRPLPPPSPIGPKPLVALCLV